MNIIAWLEYKLAYYDITVQHFGHYAALTPPHIILCKQIIIIIINIIIIK